MKVLFYISISLLAQVQAIAQTTEEIKKRYPDEQAVLLNASAHYTMQLKEGAPYIESREKQQLLYLSSNAAAYMSRYGFSHSNFHELREYEAYTRTPADKKIKVTGFKTGNHTSGSVFYDDVKETLFDFPSISAGATGNLEVQLVHKKPFLLSPYYFTRVIPVVRNELKLSYPKSISVKYLLQGLDTSLIKVTREEKRDNVTLTFETNYLEAEKRYPDAPDNSWYSPHVIFYIDSYIDDQGKKITYLSTLDDLYKLYRSFIAGINQATGPELKHLADSLTQYCTTDKEKAQQIYSWVQNNIKYVAFEDGMEGFIPRDANFVCSRRYGDCKDMSSILTILLRAAGVPAYYTWIGTRHLPYSYTDCPLPVVDNHMICAIKPESEYIFLDGTDPDCLFGMPAQGIQDKEALIAINDTTYEIIKVPVPSKEVNTITDTTFLELTEEGLKGEIKKYLAGYCAMDMHHLLRGTNERERETVLKEHFARGSNKFQLLDFRTDAIDRKNVFLSARFNLQDYAKKADGDWYLNLNLFKLYEHAEIDYPRRKMPVESEYKFCARYVTVLTVPEGYKVSHLPASQSYKNDLWGFSLQYRQTGNKVILSQEFYNDRLLLYHNQFGTWNEVLKHLLPLYKETIGLSKK